MEDVATVEGQRGVLNPEPKTLVDEEESTCKDARFEAIFFKYYPRVVGMLCRLLGDRARAEELASDVFWKLYRQPGSLDQTATWAAGFTAPLSILGSTTCGHWAADASTRRRPDAT